MVRSLGGEDPVEEGIVTPSSVLARKVPQTQEPDGPWFMGLKTVKQDCSDSAGMHPVSPRLFHHSDRTEL